MPVGIPEYAPPAPTELKLLERTGCPIFIKRLNQTFIFANPAFRDLYPGCTIVGRNGQALFGAQQAASFLRQDRACLADGIHMSQWNGPNGRRYLMQKIALPNESGPPDVGGVLFDITDYRDDAADALEEMKQLKAEADAKALLLAEAADKIEYVSLHDAHTGLANRRYLERQMEAHSSAGDAIAIITIDLDRFKQINDSAGHFAGDHVLRHVASALTKASRLGDFVARVGGDEFTILCEYADDHARIVDVASEILQLLEKPIDFRGQSLRIGASIGVAIPDNMVHSPDDLLIAADLALYRAKAQGRGQVVLFERRMQIEAREEERRAAELEEALSAGQFRAHYQAQIQISTGTLVGVEALARWYHPSQGILAPGAFLDIAERSNRLAALDGAVLRDARAIFHDLHVAREHVPKLSVNISADGLTRADLFSDIDLVHLPPGAMSIELLETILFDGAEAEWRAPIDGLKSRGIGVEIDDFGTGRASIVSLLSISPNVMKLDRQFVADLPDSAEARKLVAAMIDIGRTLGIEVLAEGVETVAQARILADLGCDLVQGYLFGQPVPPENLETVLDRPASYWQALLGRAYREANPRLTAAG